MGLNSRFAQSTLAEPGEDHLVAVLGTLRAVLSDIASVRCGMDELRAIITSKRKDHYTVEEVAELVGRAPYTVRKWISNNQLRAIRVSGTGPRGRLLIARSEIESLVGAGRGGAISDVVV